MAEIGVSGSAAGRRVRVRMLAGVAAPASVRLEALAPFGAPVFIFAATNDDAALIFPSDDRVLEHGQPDQVLDAVAGVPLDAADLFAALTGCAPAFPQASARDLGDDWRVVRLAASGVGYNLFLHRDRPALPWRLVATTREGTTDAGWRAEYRDFQNNLPRSIRIAGVGPFDQPRNAAFDLTLALSQVETNVALEADVFRPAIPPGADPITLDELRRARPGIREN
jgi:hypothetical protein